MIMNGCRFLNFVMFCMWLAAEDLYFRMLGNWEEYYVDGVTNVFVPKWNNRPSLRVLMRLQHDEYGFDASTLGGDSSKAYRSMIHARKPVVKKIVLQFFQRKRVFTAWIEGGMKGIRLPDTLKQEVRKFLMPTGNAIDMVMDLFEVLGIYEMTHIMEQKQLELEQRWRRLEYGDKKRKVCVE